MKETKLIDPGPGRVLSSIERTDTGIIYRVLVEGEIVHEQEVLFGQDRRHRAGGLAFIEAAAEQDRIAQEHVKGV